MADDFPTEGDKGPRRRKAAAPTIDLAPSEPPILESQGVEAEKAGAPDVSDPAPPPPEAAVKPRRAFGVALAAGFAGAAIALGIGAAAVRFGALARSDDQVSALQARIVKLEESAGKVTPADPAMAERLTAAENAMKALGVTLTALNRRSDDIAGDAAKARDGVAASETTVAELRVALQDALRGQLAASSGGAEALQKRMAGLEQTVSAAREQIVKTTAADKVARLALSAIALRAAVASGKAYEAELNQAKSLGADVKTIAPLEAFAAAGLPSPQVLTQQLRALLPELRKVSNAPVSSGGFFERLQANASQLVKVQPLDKPPGDGASAVLARLEIDAANADIARALADLGKLDDAARAPALQWIGIAQGRQAALTASENIAAEAARALGSQ